MSKTELYRLTSDWDCLNRAREGDENAWRMLFQRHYTPLVRMTALITGSMDVAKDLVQETFYRLLRGETRHSEGNFKAYLSTIAYRLALKEVDRRQRNHSLQHHELVDGNPTPLESAVLEEREKHVVRVVNSLPEHQRDILVLRFYGGHSYEEISEMTGVPLGTVKSRIFYAVKACQKKLRQRGVL